ncbi:MAG: sulfurtransferase, partial [Pseudomonadales bacterium]
MSDYTRHDYLVEPKRLAEQLNSNSLRIYDATVFLRPADRGYRAESGLSEYEAGHVPGAAFLDQINDVSDTSTGLGFTLPSPDQLQTALREAGISNHDRVVFYSSSHIMWATRAWWLLHYAGHEQVAVLNGGLSAWRAAKLEVEQGINHYPKGTMTVSPRAERFVGTASVLAAIGDADVCTVNALAPEVYSGESKMSYGRKGHISGSINLHYDELLDDGRFRESAELEVILRAKGLLDADRIISYCGGGISATIDAFACLLVGKNEVAVYDGSMSAWVKDESLP